MTDNIVEIARRILVVAGVLLFVVFTVKAAGQADSKRLAGGKKLATPALTATALPRLADEAGTGQPVASQTIITTVAHATSLSRISAADTVRKPHTTNRPTLNTPAVRKARAVPRELHPGAPAKANIHIPQHVHGITMRYTEYKWQKQMKGNSNSGS